MSNTDLIVRPDPREVREMLRAMQAGELTVSRGVELLGMWLAGNYTDKQLPPVRQDLIEEDSMPVEIIDRLNAELAGLAGKVKISIPTDAMEQSFAREYDRGFKAGKAALKAQSEPEGRELRGNRWQKTHVEPAQSEPVAKFGDLVGKTWAEAHRKFPNLKNDELLYTHPAPAPKTVYGWPATHLKTGHQYIVTGERINATNIPIHPGAVMVDYERDGQKFCREVGEFQEKFAAKKWTPEQHGQMVADAVNDARKGGAA